MFLRTPIIYSLLHVFTSALYEGDDCTLWETRQEGKCVSVLKCEYAKKLLQTQKRPQHCGYNSQVPLVCCPGNEKLENPPGSKSLEKCKEYHDVDKQRVGIAAIGDPALPKEFPHMAALGFGEKNNILWLCGGTLISEKFILTAAHCINSAQFGKVKWVRLGDLDLKNTTEDASPLDLAIIRHISHPDYKPPIHYHDVALLELEEVVKFGIYYKPACLQAVGKLPESNVQATGWGKTGYAEDPSSHLIKADLDVVNQEQCARDYVKISSRKLPRGILEQFQICAGDLSEKKRDTCPGDSGGPLHYFVKATDQYVKHYVVAGITSFGKGCGFGSPGVYTRVSAYVEWIENIVWPV